MCCILAKPVSLARVLDAKGSQGEDTHSSAKNQSSQSQRQAYVGHESGHILEL